MPSRKRDILKNVISGLSKEVVWLLQPGLKVYFIYIIMVSYICMMLFPFQSILGVSILLDSHYSFDLVWHDFTIFIVKSSIFFFWPLEPVACAWLLSWMDCIWCCELHQNNIMILPTLIKNIGIQYMYIQSFPNIQWNSLNLDLHVMFIICLSDVYLTPIRVRNLTFYPEYPACNTDLVLEFSYHPAPCSYVCT